MSPCCSYANDFGNVPPPPAASGEIHRPHLGSAPWATIKYELGFPSLRRRWMRLPQDGQGIARVFGVVDAPKPNPDGDFGSPKLVGKFCSARTPSRRFSREAR